MGDSQERTDDAAGETAAYAAYLAADLVPPDDAGEAPEPIRVAPGRMVRLVAALRRLLHPAAPGTLTPRRLLRALSRRSRRLALQRLRRLPCFRADEYVYTYPDVARAGVEPHRHALFVGGYEQRRLFRAETLARCLGAPLAPAAALPRCTTPLHVGIYVNSLGNVFMRELAEDIAASLGAELLDESAPIAGRPSTCVFMAPHEFFVLGRGIEWAREAVIAGSVMLNTEQPQTRWFGRGLPFLLASRGVIDLSPQTAALIAATGTPSLHLAPAPHLATLTAADRLHPLFRVLPRAARGDGGSLVPFAARPLDFCFFGSESRLREQFLARHARALAAFESVVHYRREDRGPIRPGTLDGSLTRLAQHVGGQAKIVLNLHRDVFGTLEWHRMVRLGIAVGAVVVSEPCLPHPLLTPGVHYFEAASRQIPELMAWLLRSEDGRRAAAEVQAAGRALLAEVVTPAATAAVLRDFLHAHAGPR